MAARHEVSRAGDWPTEGRIRRHARSGCPYSTSLDLCLGLLPGPGSAPLLLGLAGGAMVAAAVPTGRDGWDWPNHLYHLPTTSPKPGNVDGIKAATT